MSGIWVIIPLKPLAKAKSRLAEAYTPHQRQQLAETMFRHVLSVVQHAPQLAGILVISRDPKALTIAREYGARTVQETGSAPDLNVALMRATSVVSSWRGKGVLVLPADLPLINREDLTNIVMLGRSPLATVIATDRSHDGTNALLVKPPGLFSYEYGPGSFERHMTLARSAGADVSLYESERVALDIDVPEDLAEYDRLTNGQGRLLGEPAG